MQVAKLRPGASRTEMQHQPEASASCTEFELEHIKVTRAYEQVAGSIVSRSKKFDNRLFLKRSASGVDCVTQCVLFRLNRLLHLNIELLASTLLLPGIIVCEELVVAGELEKLSCQLAGVGMLSAALYPSTRPTLKYKHLQKHECQPK
jgi:hypothetical protein